MALIIKDRIKEGSSSTGTGNIALGGAAATFDTFSSVMVNGDTTYYAIVHTTSGVDEWEVGIGTYDSALNEISRTTVLSGSAGTSAVNFSAGTKDVFMTYPAEKALYYDASGNVSFGADASIAGDLVLGGYLDLNVFADGSEPAHNEGRIFYQQEYGTLSVYNGEADITLQVGQEDWIRVYNNTGSTIVNGTPVYVTGAVSETPAVAPADATTVVKANVIGIATHDIEASTVGFVTARGLLSGIDTSGLTAGARIHVAADGSLQNDAPTYPYFPTDVGYCIISDATNGYIYVTVRGHTFEQFRVTGNQHIDGNLVIDGDLTITGTQSTVTQKSLAVDDSFIYMNSGNTIGAANTNFSGTGLNDAILAGHYSGTTSQTFYVRIDGVGTGTGGVDTFEWSLDNFTTTQAVGVDCSTTGTDLTDGITITFNAATGHTSGDTWSGTAAPVNVDSGTFSNRNTGTSGVGYTHMGWFYDVSTNKFTFLDAYAPEPEGTIDLGDASVSYATIKAGTFEGNLLGNVTGNITGNLTGGVTGDVSGNLTGNVTGNADTATKLATARTVQLSGDVTGSATFDGTADINIVATVGDDSHAHVISNVDGLQAALDAKADDSTTITAGNGLTGGGTLGVNTTLNVGAGTGVTVSADTVSIGQDVATTANVTFNNITVTGTVDGRDVAADGTKLDGIEAGATADQTAAEIRTLVDAATDSNVLTDALLTKLNGIEAGATGDQTALEIKTAYESNADTNAFTDAEQTKLAGIEAGATADQTAAEILTAIKTVDGAGSGLDADTLDGVQASGFAAAGHIHTLADITDSGTAAALNVGTGANNVVQLNGSAQLPAVDGSLLTGIESVPAGVITMFSGATIPSGWVVCDGLNGTPDLRDRFIVGSGSTYAAGDTGGANTVTLATANLPSHTHGVGTLVTASDGAHTHTLSGTADSAGAHNHTGNTSNTGAHSHGMTMSKSGPGNGNRNLEGNNNSLSGTGYTNSAGAHSHTLSISNTGAHTHNVSGNTSSAGAHTHTLSGSTGGAGSGTAHENRPPYYALAFIMKT